MSNWLTASAMLLSGLIVGFMFLYGMKRKGEQSDLERKDLEAKRDALIAELRAETNAEERARLEREAAAVLRKLAATGSRGLAVSESRGGTSRPRDPETPKPRDAGSFIKGYISGAATVAVLAGLGFWVMNQAKERTDPNQPITGAGPPMQQQQQAAPPDSALQQLEAAVRSNPNDLAARADLAKGYLDRENIDGVIEQTQFILQKNPNDARALTYEALVRVGIGQVDTALPMLQRATKADPKFLDAWVGLAWVHATANRMKEADEAIATAKRLRPDEAERLDQLMAHIKQPQVANAPGQGPAPAVAPSGNGVVVALNTAPNVQIPPNGILFVIARAAGVTAGPPIAVKRIPVRQFPFEVEITTADSMTGQPLPPSMNIDARLDADGDAMTKTAADLRASQDGVAMGQKITLTLR